MVLLGAGAAAHTSGLVPAGQHGQPAWLAGPLRELGVGSSTTSYQLLLAAIFACYLVALACVHALGTRRLWTAIALAHLAALLAPPLFSADVFGYLSFARLGAVHGLDPYTHTAAAAPLDAVYRYVGWRNVSSPYGPLFTLLSYTVATFSLAAGLWTLKALAAATSLATVAVVWRGAERLGHEPLRAAALIGLNPVVLVFVVGGGHNDALTMLLLAIGIVAFSAGRDGAGAATLAATVGIKASAALALPFALIASRRRVAATAAAAAGLAAVAAVAVIGFGLHTRAFLDTLRGQQQFVAVHSIPSEVSRLLGLGRLASGVRAAFTAGFVIALVAALVHAWRNRDHWIDAYGWATLALLVGTAWLLPWYGVWLLLPAALSDGRRLRIAALTFSAYLILTRMPFANGVLG